MAQADFLWPPPAVIMKQSHGKMPAIAMAGAGEVAEPPVDHAADEAHAAPAAALPASAAVPRGASLRQAIMLHGKFGDLQAPPRTLEDPHDAVIEQQQRHLYSAALGQLHYPTTKAAAAVAAAPLSMLTAQRQQHLQKAREVSSYPIDGLSEDCSPRREGASCSASPSPRARASTAAAAAGPTLAAKFGRIPAGAALSARLSELAQRAAAAHAAAKRPPSPPPSPRAARGARSPQRSPPPPLSPGRRGAPGSPSPKASNAATTTDSRFDFSKYAMQPAFGGGAAASFKAQQVTAKQQQQPRGQAWAVPAQPAMRAPVAAAAAAAAVPRDTDRLRALRARGTRVAFTFPDPASPREPAAAAASASSSVVTRQTPLQEAAGPSSSSLPSAQGSKASSGGKPRSPWSLGGTQAAAAAVSGALATLRQRWSGSGSGASRASSNGGKAAALPSAPAPAESACDAPQTVAAGAAAAAVFAESGVQTEAASGNAPVAQDSGDASEGATSSSSNSNGSKNGASASVSASSSGGGSSSGGADTMTLLADTETGAAMLHLLLAAANNGGGAGVATTVAELRDSICVGALANAGPAGAPVASRRAQLRPLRSVRPGGLRGLLHRAASARGASAGGGYSAAALAGAPGNREEQIAFALGPGGRLYVVGGIGRAPLAHREAVSGAALVGGAWAPGRVACLHVEVATAAGRRRAILAPSGAAWARLAGGLNAALLLAADERLAATPLSEMPWSPYMAGIIV